MHLIDNSFVCDKFKQRGNKTLARVAETVLNFLEGERTEQLRMFANWLNQMKKTLLVAAAQPNFMKIAPVLRELREQEPPDPVTNQFLETGQFASGR